jgi:hypothetical protein
VWLVAAAESPSKGDAKKASASVDTAQVSRPPKNTKSALDQLTNTDPRPKKTWTMIKDLFL